VTVLAVEEGDEEGGSEGLVGERMRRSALALGFTEKEPRGRLLRLRRGSGLWRAGQANVPESPASLRRQTVSYVICLIFRAS